MHRLVHQECHYLYLDVSLSSTDLSDFPTITIHCKALVICTSTPPQKLAQPEAQPEDVDILPAWDVDH